MDEVKRRKTASIPTLEVETVGRPNVDSLPKAEANAFYSTLAQMALEYYKRKNEHRDGDGEC